jgi:hypothetical protein
MCRSCYVQNKTEQTSHGAREKTSRSCKGRGVRRHPSQPTRAPLCSP